MNELFIGEFLRQRRIEKGITQEALAYGIFSDASAISRIENGKQVPSHRKLVELLERLDLPSDRYYALVDKNELAILELQTQIVSCQTRNQFKEGLIKLTEYEKLISSNDVLAQQFLLSSRAVLGTWENGQNVPFPLEEKLHLLFTALRLTVPHFEIDNIESKIYSINEIKIINQIALTYSDAGLKKISINIYQQLLHYINTHLHGLRQTTPIIILILYNYSRDLCLEHHIAEAFEISTQGLQFCRKVGNSSYLGGLLFNFAYCLYELGQEEMSQDYFNQSYYVYTSMGDTHNATIAQSAIKELFHSKISS